MNPRVAYIVAVYNSERYLRACLASCVKQTYRPIQLVVVDDGSTDRSAEIVREFRSEATGSEFEVLCIAQENRGTSAARNAGLAACTAPFVGFLDADDLLPPDRTEVLLNGLLSSGVDLAYGQTRRIPGDADESFVWECAGNVQFTEYGQTVPLVKCVPGQTQFLVRTEVVRRIGGFDERLRMAEEFEFIVRLRTQNLRMVKTSHVVYGYRMHESSNTRKGIAVRSPYLVMALIAMDKHVDGVDSCDALSSRIIGSKAFRLAHRSLRAAMYDEAESASRIALRRTGGAVRVLSSFVFVVAKLCSWLFTRKPGRGHAG